MNQFLCRKVLLKIAPIPSIGIATGQSNPDINPRNVVPVILTNDTIAEFGGFASISSITLEPSPTNIAIHVNGAPILAYMPIISSSISSFSFPILAYMNDEKVLYCLLKN